MTAIQAATLGVVQGLGEFLPISSSGHLIVLPWLLGWPEHSLAFDVALHLGTLFAVLYAFAPEWAQLFSCFARATLRGRPFDEPASRLLGLLVLASVPGALTGLLLEPWAETIFRSPLTVAFNMALMGTVLLAADSAADRSPGLVEPSLRDGLLIGCAQALAIVPGVSRAGATISMALLLGYRREASARFSFLLAMPITLGAALVEVPHLVRSGEFDSSLVGILSAAFVGFLSIRFLLAYLRARTYRIFVYYRWTFCALVLFVLALRGLQ